MKKYKKIDFAVLELGKGLCAKKILDGILKFVAKIRKDVLEERGVVIPNIRIIKNAKLRPFEYAIKVCGTEAARFELEEDSFLAIDTGDAKGKVEGKTVKEPVFRMPAYWISAGVKNKAKKSGYAVVPFERVACVHLQEIITKNLSSAITIQYVEELMDEINAENPALTGQLVVGCGNMSLPVIKNVLRGLLEEDVSVANIVPILEAISDTTGTSNTDIDCLVEKARVAIASDIITPLIQDNELPAISLSQDFSEWLLENKGCLFDKSVSEKTITQIANIVKKNGYTPVILCPREVRKIARTFISEICFFQGFRFFSIEEVTTARKLNDSLCVRCIATVGERIVPKSEEKLENCGDKKIA